MDMNGLILGRSSCSRRDIFLKRGKVALKRTVVFYKKVWEHAIRKRIVVFHLKGIELLRELFYKVETDCD